MHKLDLRRPMLLAAVFFVAGTLWLPSSAVAASKMSVALTAIGASSVPQGVPFDVKATVSSQTSSADQVTLKLIRGGKTIPFNSQLAVVPPGASAEIESLVTPSKWFPQLGKYQIVAVDDKGQTISNAPLTFTVTKAPLKVPVFKDVTVKAGLVSKLDDSRCGEWSNGAAWADVNHDGRLDLYLTRQARPAALYINKGKGKFVDEAAARGVTDTGGISLGASFADYDNDGHPDLFVANDGVSRLYHNDGTGHFTDVSAKAGITADGPSMSGSWADYDNDGHLDLYVANHSRCTGNSAASIVYYPDHLYHNNGNGTFTDVTRLVEHDPASTLDGATIGAGFLGAWFDYNNDGRQDLYLANDYLGAKPDRNHLWRNDGAGANGDWQFTDVSVQARAAFSMNTMGVGIGDYNRDGWLDLALTNITSNVLLKNNGDGTFTDVAHQTNVQQPYQQADSRSVTWGATFGDLNLDGWEDLYVGAGYLWTLGSWYGERFATQPNELLVNNHAGAFYDLSAASHANDRGQTRGIAVADYDRDGRLDLYVVNQAGTPRLLHNVTPMGRDHWLEVNTIGTVSNRDGCGARVTVTIKGGSMIREIHCGSTSVSSGGDKVAHFGLSTSKKFKLQIRWPSGISQTYRNLKPDRLVTLKEPKA